MNSWLIIHLDLGIGSEPVFQVRGRTSKSRDVIAVAEVEKERSALENVPPNIYESVCVPDLSEYLGDYHSLAGGEQKVASSGTSSGGGHPPSAGTPTPASNASSYLHDGKYPCLPSFCTINISNLVSLAVLSR
jgi:hypothetical protein